MVEVYCLPMASDQVRAEHFRFFAEALKTAKLKLYVPHFVQEAEVSGVTCPKDAFTNLRPMLQRSLFLHSLCVQLM